MPGIQEVLIEILNSVGGLVCHQLPERTFEIGGHLLCVCARDTGIYIGILVGLLLVVMGRRERSGPPSLYLILAMILPLILDGSTQALGLRTSTNQLRLVTGLLFGTAISPFLVYLLPLLPLPRRIPVLRSIVPSEPNLDGDDPWLPAHALAVGIVIDIVLFLLIDSVAGSADPVLYWVVTLPIAFSLLLTVFVIPALVLVSFIDFYWAGIGE